MSDSPFAELDLWLQGLLDRVDPAQIKPLSSRYARELRHANQQRISAQQNPDGSGYAPRSEASLKIRARRGRIRRSMFARLRLAAHLQAHADGQQVTVGFTGRSARIALVHHYGLRDRVNDRLQVKYPSRKLLGITDQDEAQLADMLLQHMAL